MIEFEPYHVHSCYSNCLTQPDSTMFIEDYAKVFKERGHHVLCLSEHGNRSNVWEQFDLAKKYSDDTFTMTPLAAAEVYFVPDRLKEIDSKKDDRHFHLILVAKNMEGFHDLNEAISEANLTGFYRYARVDLDILSRLNYKNFLCTTACVGGIMKDPEAERLALQLHEIFKENFYLEVQHHPQQIQCETNMKVLRLYQKYHWPLIYGTDSHYVNKEDAALRKELLLSAKITYGNEDEFCLHLPTAQEAYQLLFQQGVLSKARIEEAMENTLQLREFEGVHFTNDKKIPVTHPELSLAQRNHMYKKLCCYSYIDKAGMPNDDEAKQIHEEMDTIANTDTADYFLALKDIVDKGKEYGGVLTMTGRGSGASFCTNYALGFSSINRLHSPIKMYPERFISADRLANGLPDLDLNMANVPAFEKAGKEILGEYGCLPMIAFGTLKTLSAFKLLARARDLDFETANEVSKQISNYELDVKHALENNADDPDYDVTDDVKIENYIEAQYLPLIEDSKQYNGIITSISPHPCAHILLDKDLRREIGVIRVKSKAGSKEPVYAAYIDGRTADAQNYVKADFLRVDVVKIISEAFHAAGLEIMTVDELLEAVKNDEQVWDLYWKGFTQGLNQCEQPKSAQRCMQYKPKSIEELGAFVAAIRPGFKSMLNTFITRQHFEYGIPSLDKLLQTKAIPDSFLMYDEQILQILKAAGIPGPDAYACTKAIKKKKHEKVMAYKERFREGFAKYLQKTEGASEEKANDVVERIWTIIENAASYMFCAAHSLSMACDSLYVAWLKVHYPFELYTTMLKLYDEKKNKDKLASIITEMKAYRHILMTNGEFGQDNRDWRMDKENNTISQSISAVKFMSKQAAEDLYELGLSDEAEMGTQIVPAKLNKEGKAELKRINQEIKQVEYDWEYKLIDSVEAGEKASALSNEKDLLYLDDKYLESKAEEIVHKAKLDCFTNVLRAIQMNTSLNTRQIEVLISIGYFKRFGQTGKLMQVYHEFFEGSNKLTKTIKSFPERLEKLREYEQTLQDFEMPIVERLTAENDNIGLCFSTYMKAPSSMYFVQDVDDKFGIRIKLYSVQRGTTGTVRFSKDAFAKQPFGIDSCIRLLDGEKRPRFTFRNGKRIEIPGEKEYWVKKYEVYKQTA